jgi:hypothetical protein
MAVEAALEHDLRAFRHPCLGAVSPSMARCAVGMQHAELFKCLVARDHVAAQRAAGGLAEEASDADLWRELWALCQARNVGWRWVMGHAGNPMNEACHRMVEEAIKRRS